MDLLPTFTNLSEAEIPQDHVITVEIFGLFFLARRGQFTPWAILLHSENELRAVRSGKWKYHKILPGKSDRTSAAADSTTALYDLEADIGETNDLSDQYPDIVERLRGYVREFEFELGVGDSLSKQCRPAGWVSDPKPLTMSKGWSCCVKS